MTRCRIARPCIAAFDLGEAWLDVCCVLCAFLPSLVQPYNNAATSCGICFLTVGELASVCVWEGVVMCLEMGGDE